MRRTRDSPVGTLYYERAALVAQAVYRECCQASDVHRFDCAEVERELRGAGPFGPVREP